MSEKNGRATLRDLMDLQNITNNKLDRIHSRINKLEIKVAIISGSIAIIISVITKLI